MKSVSLVVCFAAILVIHSWQGPGVDSDAQIDRMSLVGGDLFPFPTDPCDHSGSHQYDCAGIGGCTSGQAWSNIVSSSGSYQMSTTETNYGSCAGNANCTFTGDNPALTGDGC